MDSYIDWHSKYKVNYIEMLNVECNVINASKIHAVQDS